ncbi:glutamate-binding protein [Streptomyces longispororuber]|uniref:Glutamate-binding protein n=1 Tax=Streptomyces longispororuber TaxID=68230 RepID=A0A919A0S1_9ACTN|nr:transporter substrate-binding domain-containing protein [Streptomyces longispororuber]GHE81939.1 glutamate-binding protein [Streptomyces longispororuber]
MTHPCRRLTRRSALAVAAATALLAAPVACAPDGGDGDDASVLTGTTHIGTSFDHPGFSLHAGRTVRGLDVDLASYLGEAIGFTPRFQDVTIDAREQELREGAADLVISVYSITPERQKVVDFVGPYLMTQQGFLVREDYDGIKSEKDVRGKLLCTAEKSTSSAADLPPEATFLEERDFSTCVRKLQRGSVDAVFSDEAMLFGYVQQQRRSKVPLRVVPNVSFGLTNRYGIGLKKGHTDDCRKLLRALRTYLVEEWAGDVKVQLPALVDAYPADWENRFKPDPHDLNTYSSCRK